MLQCKFDEPPDTLKDVSRQGCTLRKIRRSPKVHRMVLQPLFGKSIVSLAYAMASGKRRQHFNFIVHLRYQNLLLRLSLNSKI